MAKKQKLKQEKSKVGMTLNTALGHTYVLISENSTSGEKLYQYKWLECPNPDYIFESKKPYDSLDMGNAILTYKLDHRIYK